MTDTPITPAHLVANLERIEMLTATGTGLNPETTMEVHLLAGIGRATHDDVAWFHRSDGDLISRAADNWPSGAHRHWRVTVETGLEKIVCIETECLSGRELSDADEATIREAAHHLLAFVGATIPASQPVAQEPVAWPGLCDGIEQDAFEAWAKSEHFDMAQHPLHWLFLNPRTDASRSGWKAGLVYAVERMKLTAPEARDYAARRDALDWAEAELLAERAKVARLVEALTKFAKVKFPESYKSVCVMTDDILLARAAIAACEVKP